MEELNAHGAEDLHESEGDRRQTTHILAFCKYSKCDDILGKTVWPSGLRRWLQAPVRKGVGSNPTAVICCPKQCDVDHVSYRASDRPIHSEGGAVLGHPRVSADIVQRCQSYRCRFVSATPD